jgi:predicted DNA-binding transcriptional regulator YafY
LAAVRKGVLRAYRLSRIELSPHPHELLGFKPDSTILTQLEDEESIWFGQEKQEIILTVHADVALHFQQRPLLPEQQVIKKLDDGGLLLSSRITHHTQILPLVRYWIPHLKIVSPEGLQDEMELRLKEYLGIY